MYLTNENLTLVKKNESLFVSLKYLDSKGNLNQIDSATKNILTDPHNHGFEVSKNICLLPIDTKGFSDPFRVLPTTSFFCVNLADDLNTRKYASKLVYDFLPNMVATFEAELKFWIEPSLEESYSCKVDPFDCYSNFRSDILETLEKIEIKTTIHLSGNRKGECIIGFKGKNIIDLADNFILARFVINNIAADYGYRVIFNQDKEPNLELILVCNNNDGKMFLDNFIANSSLICEYNHLLQMGDLNSKSLSKRVLFNEDCKLQIKLTTGDNFIPYMNFAFIVLCLSENKEILTRLGQKEVMKFIKNYKRKLLIKTT
ncbi:MAG: hypothetical protein FJX70_00520 [Alphaproteobacteria bacterium]|nr:hypothetical protein [Alphaproteobacteria bacterium]